MRNVQKREKDVSAEPQTARTYDAPIRAFEDPLSLATPVPEKTVRVTRRERPCTYFSLSINTSAEHAETMEFVRRSLGPRDYRVPRGSTSAVESIMTPNHENPRRPVAAATTTVRVVVKNSVFRGLAGSRDLPIVGRR